MNKNIKQWVLPAEWEPQDAVQLTWPDEQTDWAALLQEVIPCYIKIIAEISSVQKVVIVARDPEKVLPHLPAATHDQILMVKSAINDTWARDHGGISLRSKDNDALAVADFRFNAWGEKFSADQDNAITNNIFLNNRIFNAAVKRLDYDDFVLEGGAIDTDGQGTILTTAACLLNENRNPDMSQEEITGILKERLGASRILWLHHGFLQGDDTDSPIDTLARFCDPDTIAYVKCYDPEDLHADALLHMEQELKQFRTAAGKPYKLIPLPLPTPVYDDDGLRLPATYANFLIINEKVLVPTYGVDTDEEALLLLQQAFGQRTIVPIDCSVLIKEHGSLHCITMQYPNGILLG